MELYLAFNIDNWGSKDLFDYINGADEILDLIPKTPINEKNEIMQMSTDQQIALLFINKV